MKIKGIDVSHWQGNIDWDHVASDGVKFAFIKATQGTKYGHENYFHDNVQKAIDAGIHVGAYHYGTFGNEEQARDEARYFLSVVERYDLNYPLVLDLEENDYRLGSFYLTNAAIAFLEEIEKSGRFAMLYTGKSFLENTLDESRLKPYALWVARYNSFLGRDAHIWQHTSKGRVKGIRGNVDLNWSYRDFAAEIKAMSKSEHKTIKKPKKESKHNLKSVVPYPGHLIKRGSRGKDVERIQRAVGVKADGIYGPVTERAVRAYQKRHGLVADGLVGPKTWGVMF